MKGHHYIQVFEYSNLRIGDKFLDVRTQKVVVFTSNHRDALESFHGNRNPFFGLIHRGVRFNQHVGVLQIGDLTIEVLPKTDNGSENKAAWQKFLISMLRVSGIMPEITGSSNLKLRNNSILDLFMQLFLQETRYLVQRGLVRKYRKTEGNATALKGSLKFAENIRHNLTHAERFFVCYTIYDKDHTHNALLSKTIELIKRISNDPGTIALANQVSLDFPECSPIPISEALFERLHFDRKTEPYRKAIGMAKLLLMKYHPEVKHGSSNVIALMFDMNELWEKYVFRILKKEIVQNHSEHFYVKEQVRNLFWRPDGGRTRVVKPDIVVYSKTSDHRALAVMDTKWKRLKYSQADSGDLKQMLVYNLYNDCDRSALIYPSNEDAMNTKGSFQIEAHGHCQLFLIPLVEDAQRGFYLNTKVILDWLRN